MGSHEVQTTNTKSHPLVRRTINVSYYEITLLDRQSWTTLTCTNDRGRWAWSQFASREIVGDRSNCPKADALHADLPRLDRRDRVAGKNDLPSIHPVTTM
jgi:hypothetical protein